VVLVRVGDEVAHEGAAEPAAATAGGHDQPVERDAARVLARAEQDGRMAGPQRVDDTVALPAASRDGHSSERAAAT
jgi:hypothetical protein